MPNFLSEYSSTYTPEYFDYLFQVRTFLKYHYYIPPYHKN